MLELAVHLPVTGSEDGDHEHERAQHLTTEGIESLNKVGMNMGGGGG